MRDYVRNVALPAEITQIHAMSLEDRVRDFKDKVLRPKVEEMLRKEPEVLWMFLRQWAFGGLVTDYSEEEKKKWAETAYRYNLSDAEAKEALLGLLDEIATQREGVWFLKTDPRLTLVDEQKRSAEDGCRPS